MSQLNVDSIKDRTGADQPDIVGVAKAWGVVTADSGSISIDNSFGLSSVTDVAAGRVSYNLSITLPNTNYGVTLGWEGVDNGSVVYIPHLLSGSKTTTSFDTLTERGSNGDNSDLNAGGKITFAVFSN